MIVGCAARLDEKFIVCANGDENVVPILNNRQASLERRLTVANPLRLLHERVLGLLADLRLRARAESLF